jgi:hydroxymethylpyrimidine pyrophosphatase-like HAD family hydrolase
LNDINFLKEKSKESKAYHHNLDRIGFQRSSPQNNFRRIIAAPIKKGLYCFDTVSYVTEKSTNIDLDVLLAFLNSKLYDWYFSATSTNSKINEYQFNILPFIETIKKDQDKEFNDCIKNKQYAEAVNRLIEYIDKYKLVPSWAFDLLKILSQNIQKIEGKRILNARKERAFLDVESQKLQRFIDSTIYAFFLLNEEDISLVATPSRK